MDKISTYTNEQEANLKKLRELAEREGMVLFGVADIRPLRDQFLLPGDVSNIFDSGISIGYRLSRTILSTLKEAPNQIYYFHYQRVNILLDQACLKISAWIQARNYEAFPIPASQVIDWEQQRGSLSHREVARLAGHGWYGKNNLLVHPVYGSQIRYATVLTNLPLHRNAPIKGDCGECSKCIDICPAGAIGQGIFSIEACTAKLKEFMKIQKIGQRICGLCVKACSRRYDNT